MSRAFMIYGSTTGNTESATETIEEQLSNNLVTVINVSGATVRFFEETSW